MRLAKAASSLPASKSLPGTMPILASFATIGRVGRGGRIVFISFASSVK